MIATDTYKIQIIWRNVFAFLIYHLLALHGLYIVFTNQANWKTSIWGIFLIISTGQGVTSGAHRLWAHRTYQAKLPLRILLCFCQTMSFQKDVYDWVRDHRVHHKFTETDADPHNSTRGFFFSHIGWLMMRKHPEVTAKGETIDFSDLEADPIIMFQRKYYYYLAFVFALIFPIIVPCYYWNENVYASFCVAGILRHLYVLHATCLVNSAAHIFGSKPYDRRIRPVENLMVSMLTFGEGWHNYHHAFPWDYKAAELKYFGNWNAFFIEFMVKIGWAYNLKSASADMVKKRILRTGPDSNVPNFEQFVKTSDYSRFLQSDDNGQSKTM